MISRCRVSSERASGSLGLHDATACEGTLLPNSPMNKKTNSCASFKPIKLYTEIKYEPRSVFFIWDIQLNMKDFF